MRSALTFVAGALILIALLDAGSSLARSAQQSGDPAPRGVVEPLNTTCLTWPLGMASVLYLLYQYLFPALIFYGKREAIAEQTRAIRRSGLPAGSTIGSGSIGAFGVRGPLLRATLYPGGLLLQSLGLPPIPIPIGAIQSAVYSPRRRGIEIKHNSRLVAGPIFLACSADTDLLFALETLLRTGHLLTADLPAAPRTPPAPAKGQPRAATPTVQSPWVGGTRDSRRYGRSNRE